jgi:hypothetical protein
MKKLSLIWAIISVINCYSQEKKNRETYTLKLAVDSEQYYSMEVPQSAYFVKEKVLQIYVSEKVLIETEIKGDTIHAMKVVEKNKYPDRTIEVSFSQSQTDGNVMTMLNVKNPFDKTLIYDALMFTPKSQKWQPTSTIPIRPKLENFESWPHAIITLVLDNWRFK